MELILTRGQVVPNFQLPNHDGYVVHRSAYRGKRHLVLVFLPAPDQAALSYLRDLALAYADLHSAGGEVLVIVREHQDGLSELKGSLNLPFVLLSDGNGAVTAKFIPATARSGVFLTDRYGELYYSAAAADAAGLPPVSELQSWLEAINNQCSL